ncbi:MAG: 2-phospho-L-lactate transferase [Dehalococcoidia bacterium]|nr:2-phospho-L-lactate transferase [Dehalococcoidia bacterium]
MIVVLAGGVGAARFLSGLIEVVPQEEIVVVSNTGDDTLFHGLHVSPDVDIVLYTLAGLVDEERGWGLREDTFHCLQALGRLGRQTWFNLGDRDLATHIHRTALLEQRHSLSAATSSLAQALGVKVRVLPMSDERVETRLQTAQGELAFQEYLVHRGAQDAISGVRFEGAESARPAPGVLQAIRAAEGIVIAPSNPLISIGPILAVPGIRDALREARARTVAISPIVAGQALKGPLAKMLGELGMEVSALQVSRLYRDLAATLILDEADRDLAHAVTALGMRAAVTNTVMRGLAEKVALAHAALDALRPFDKLRTSVGSR